MKKIRIKVCGMRDVINITEISLLKPDYIGFIFYRQSQRYAGELNHAILESLFPCTLSVGVFVNETIDHVVETSEYYKLDALQLHGNETPEYCRELKTKYQCEIIKAFGIKSEDDFALTSGYEQVCDYFLFDSKTCLYGGSGTKFDHSLLKNYTSEKPFFLSGGITLQDAPDIKNNLHRSCIGIDINSGFEISSGLKNVEKVRKFINFFRTDTNEQDI
jgi:phosphoribosylanthranilate isomerase